MEAKFSKLVLDSLFQNSDDGFIVINDSGTILDINENYSQFLGRKRDQIVGQPIENIISTTSMYDVLRNRLNDKNAPIHVQRYEKGQIKEDEPYVIGNRFCVYDENQNLIGAAAQMKFRQRSLDISQKYKETEWEYYREEYRNSVFRKSGFSNFIGNASQILRLKNMAYRASQTAFPVLITGETGTGKEVLAKSIHLESDRHDKPFVAINCGAIPAELFESELFGYESGAFTGARKNGKIGKFEAANGGTLFLDEIGDMPMHMQVKLLRVLQEQELVRVGGTKNIPLDVRIISATRQNLFDMMSAGTFREDLYYRLAVVNIQTVPLRENPQDILLHVYHHLDRLNQQYRTEVTISEDVKEALQAHRWPGNVRELQNVISSAYAMCENSVITPDSLPLKIASLTGETVFEGNAGIGNNITHENDAGSSPVIPAVDSISSGGTQCLKSMMNHYEEILLRQALEKNEHNMTEAAKMLGIERSLLYKKLNKYHIK